MKEVILEELAELDYKTVEAYRTLRTNLRFTGDDVKTVLFTSAMPNEGKSTVVFNLARSLNDSGNKVLVIDSDMRKSVLMGRYGARDAKGGDLYGLSHYLSGQVDLNEALYWNEQMPNVGFIFSGTSVLNATELLEKKYFKKLVEAARDKFEYVLIDCAPLGAVIDAAVIAPLCDGAVIVTGQKDATSRMVVNVKKQLETAEIPILGVVMNKVRMNRGGRYGKYYSQYYNKYYSDERDEKSGKSGKSGKKRKREADEE